MKVQLSWAKLSFVFEVPKTRCHGDADDARHVPSTVANCIADMGVLIHSHAASG
jgi:hypothetical protein